MIKVVHTKAVREKEDVVRRKTRRWDFLLFVAGHNSKTTAAFNNLKRICEVQLKGHYRIKVIDLLKHPRIAREHQIFALPTLIRSAPLPVKNIIGDLSNAERLLNGLGLMNERIIQRM